MRKSLSFTFLIIIGVVLFSIASCGGSSERQLADTDSEDAREYAQVEEELYDTHEEEEVVNNFKTFPIYTDARSPDNHYIASGYMGDSADVSVEMASFEEPHSGTTCIKTVYANAISQGARWSGVYWQNPANNWGEREGGFDLTGASKLTFWVRGEKGGERIEEFKMGGLAGLYPDSDIAGIGPVLLTSEWKQYEIDLRGKDLSYISGGFAWATNIDVNPDGVTFYLDDIRYE
ncbi:hypothetical protein ACFL28_00035 [Candidatus Omnitrophota bacterium]